MNKKLITNMLVSLVTVILMLLCAEIIMRFSWQMGGWIDRPIYRRSFNPYIRYELVPQAKLNQEVCINSDGFRGPDYSLEKPAGTFRIIMLGDSETFSISLKQKDTLPAQLENLLNQKAPGRHFEVFNFGLEGYNTFQELEQLKTKGLKYKPDLVILNYVFNDPEPGEYYFEKNFLIRHSALARYFAYRIKKGMIKRERKRLNIATEIENFRYLHQPKYFNRTEKALLAIADIAKKATGKNLVIVIIPTSSIYVKDFNENYPYGYIHALIKNTPSNNIVFVDLIEQFRALHLTPQDVSINYAVDESHKNGPAYKVSAEYIYGTLKSKNLIPQ